MKSLWFGFHFVWIIFIPHQSQLVTGLPNNDAHKTEGPVFLLTVPETVAFADSKGASISCTAFGRPAPELDWVQVDGSPVEEVSGLLDILPNNTLYFPPFDSSQFAPSIHNTQYRCKAKNVVGVILSRNVTVRAVLVDQYKNYNVQLNDKWVMEGATAVLKCVVNPYYVKDYVQVIGWTQRNHPIVAGGRISILPSGELHIRDVRKADGLAMYSCRSKNILTGDERGSAFATLHVHDPPASDTRPTIDTFLTELTLSETSTAELPCVSSQALPYPQYTWSKNGVPVVIDNNRVLQNGGNLMIKDAITKDSGDYKCNATNRRGTETISTRLTITSTLSAIVSPSEQTVDAGLTATYNCSTSGYPIESVTWFKDGKPLVIDERVYILSDTTLIIRDVKRQDQGMYQCFLANQKEVTQGTAQLTLGAAKPTILDSFQEQFVKNGQQVSLLCKATGNPIPAVKWRLDGADLPLDDRIKSNTITTLDGYVISFVNISRVKVEDGGEYSCHATSDVGYAEYMNRLNVYGIPYIRPMPNVTATANMKLSIRCYVSGYPVNTIKWYRDGHMLPMNHLQKVEDGTLIIEKVQRNYDAGRYTCQAKNHEGLGMTRSVYVTVVEPPVVDEFSFGYRKEGDRIMISCVVSSGDLPITIGWYKDSNPIPHDLGVVIQTIGPFSSLLSISDVSPRHNGNYTCYASNAAAYTNYTAPLHVQVPPRWVIKPQNSFVVLHQSVQLDCQTAGTPTPVITWKKAADTMSPDTYETIFFDPEDQNMQLLENGTLFIKNARESEHGHYLCQASNGIGYPISHRVFLTVRVPARFDAPQKNYTVLNNHNITLECQGIGDKPLSITWSFKGSPLSTNGNKRARVVSHDTPRGKLSQLSLQPANRSDSGFYVCNAKNKFGHDDLMIQLVVIEPPEPPKEVRIINTTSRAITLSWKPPYDGNNPIIAYTVQFRNNSGVWQGTLANVTVPAGQHSVTLDELKPSYIYNIRIMANNSVGYSIPSPDQVVTTEEEAPTGPPGNVVAKAIGSQSLQVTWESPADGYVNGKILGYYIGYKETNSPSHFIYITQTVGEDFQAKHTIHNLKKFTEYTVHVKAYNAKGISPASNNIQVFTLEDVPSQPPQNVQANPVSSVAIRVLYAPPPLYTLHGILLGYKVLYKPVRNDEDESDASFVTTDSMEAMLYKLEKYTNYSIQVLAYTRKGEGVRSEPIYVTTQEDLPESPSDIKSLPVNSSSILVAWQLPEHPNGEITEFNLYVLNNTADSKNLEDKVKLPADTSSYLVSNLQVGHQYGFRITASTMIGEGKPTALILASPQENVPARIASFSTKLIVPWHESIIFPCLAVGDPEPSVAWKLRGHTLKQSERVKVLENGSLYFDDVIGTDAANYSCHAKNKHGFDDITYILQVQAPPQPARLYLALTTSSTIQVNWLSGSNGGSPIQGFVLNYKKEHGSWQDIRLGPQNRTYIAANLLCGTLYKFNIRAFNRLGDSLDSDIVTAKTNGSVPIMPPQSMLVKEVNATSVILDLRTWQTSGCPIRFFSVKYQVFGDNMWTFVSNSMRYNTTLFTVQDLHPATWYRMVVTAHSDAGSSESKLTFATLTYTGSTILPIQVIHKEESEFYEKITIMVPLCAGLVSLSVAIVGSILFCRRRRERLRYKEHASNLRRDITAETSLMNDLDKRLNVDLDSSTSTLPEFSKRNVNLLISLHSDDNINGNSQSWLIDSSKTNSENGSFSRSEDEGNINPYATFNELKAVVNTGKRVEMMQKSSESEDEIALQKAANQREGLMATPCEPYVPFFHSKGATGTVPRKPPPLPKTRPPRRTRHEEVKKEGYDNHGVLLSPRKYASADQIHALFTQAPPRPPSCHKSGSGSSDKGSQRHSLISSVTTVSSSRDELLEALENAKKNPPPPVLFESQNDDSSQPTDSSIATEPGIREFTQSPPKPNEQREASCEVPSYEQQKRRRQHRKEMESDTTECEGGELQDHSPPRRTIRGRRNKQKPQIISKRSLGTTFIPRAHSRTSTTSSEEVTYTFGGRESPRSNSPSEGYLPYPRDGYGYPETDVVTRTRRDNKSRGRGTGRGTPHGKRRYDVSIQTPGTDENKPLVMALAQPALTSPAEEDEHVSLLDRHYRPLPEEDGSDKDKDKRDKGYTDDFTIV